MKKKKFDTLKKTLNVVRRHSLDEEIDDVADNGDELPQVEEVTPFSIFFTKNGAYIISSLIAFVGLYYTTAMF